LGIPSVIAQRRLFAAASAVSAALLLSGCAAAGTPAAGATSTASGGPSATSATSNDSVPGSNVTASYEETADDKALCAAVAGSADQQKILSSASTGGGYLMSTGITLGFTLLEYSVATNAATGSPLEASASDLVDALQDPFLKQLWLPADTAARGLRDLADLNGRCSTMGAAAAIASPTPAPTSHTSGGQAPSSESVKLVPGCQKGTVLASHDANGVLIQIVKRSFGVDLCLDMPGGSVVHADPQGMTTYGEDARAFPSGSYFKTDSLGHIFTQIDPGTISGVTVIVPGEAGTEVLEFGQATVVSTADPFKITTSVSDCRPNCASGHTTTSTLSWDAAIGSYR
jgi:hypothetical protein